METKISWQTIFGIVILGSIMVFSLAALPMSGWVESPEEMVLSLNEKQEQQASKEQASQEFHFAPVEIAVGSPGKTTTILSETKSISANQSAENQQQIATAPDHSQPQDPSIVQQPADATVNARQRQADQLLEIAESLVIRETPALEHSSEPSDVETSQAPDTSELLAVNPLASDDRESLLNEANSLALEADMRDDFQSLELSSDQWLVDSGEPELGLEEVSKSEIDEEESLMMVPLDSSLSESEISISSNDLPLESLVLEQPAEPVVEEAAQPLTNRIKAQTVSQTKQSTKSTVVNQPAKLSTTHNQPNRNSGYSNPPQGKIANPLKLIQELDDAKRNFPDLAQWIIQYKLAIGQLCDAAPEQQRPMLERLEELRRDLDLSFSQSDNHAERKHSTIRQLCYSLDRRLDFWQATIPGNAILVQRQRQQANHIHLIRSRRWNFANVNITPQWSEYLMWPQLVQIVNSSSQPKAEKQQYAREILTRINSGRLDFQQEAVVGQLLPMDLQRQLYRHAEIQVDPKEVLSAIEAYEWQGDDLSAMRIMEGYRWLRLSENVADQQVVDLIENHYRNANVRLTASREFINRWFVSQTWVNQTIAKQKENHVGIGVMPFQIDLLPSESGFHFQLSPAGQDDGSSDGWKSVTPPQSEYDEDSNDILSVAYVSDQSWDQQLTNVIGGNFQRIPFVDWISGRYPSGMAVGIKAIPIKHQVTSDSKLASELNQQLSRRFQQTEVAISNTIRGFQLAGLAPKVIENSSTTEAITARVRIADNTQLASNTARPNPIPTAVLSLQLHQSFINNTLQRTEVAGRTFGWSELNQHFATVLGWDSAHTITENNNQDTLHFAESQAIEIKLDQGQLQLHLQLQNARLGRLETGPVHLQCRFTPDISQCNVALIPDREFGWQVESPQISHTQRIQLQQHLDNLFADVIVQLTPTQWETDFLANQLEMVQFELSDGWLCVSIEPRAEEGKIALTQTIQDETPSNGPTGNSRFIQAFLSDETGSESRSKSSSSQTTPILRSVLEN